MQFKLIDLGLVDFSAAWQMQKDTFLDVKSGYLKSALILCNHYPVITTGRLSKQENIKVGDDELERKGIKVYRIERGGNVTYHGPGQITAYPIFNLEFINRDIHIFLRQLEGVVISLLSDIGISGRTFSGLTGVWVGSIFKKQKIASIGIAIKNWIVFHGLSINIKKNDLDNFRLIRPCGMDIEMTSLETILGEPVELNNIKERLILKFQDIFPSIFNDAPCYRTRYKLINF